MRFLSLFAGIGGLDLGLERAGWECVGQVEREPFCLEILGKHWPKVRKWTDVFNVRATDFIPESRGGGYGIDAVVGGFPCQPHSVAGKGLGQADERNLWPETLRIVTDLEPRWFVGENVPGLDRTMLAEIVRDLEAIGYEVGVLGLAAATVGAPHRRERRFIVARRMAYGAGERLEGHAGDGDNGDESRRFKSIEGRPACEGGLCVADDVRRESERCGRVLDRERSPCGNNADRCDGSGSALGDASSQRSGPGLCDCEPREVGRGVAPDAMRRTTEPRLGDVAHGFPGGLAGPGPRGSWPNPPGPQASWESPRVTRWSREHKGSRSALLKALGNAVVPQCGEAIGQLINAIEAVAE